jgi:hypothetical protein
MSVVPGFVTLFSSLTARFSFACVRSAHSSTTLSAVSLRIHLQAGNCMATLTHCKAQADSNCTQNDTHTHFPVSAVSTLPLPEARLSRAKSGDQAGQALLNTTPTHDYRQETTLTNSAQQNQPRQGRQGTATRCDGNKPNSGASARLAQNKPKLPTVCQWREAAYIQAASYHVTAAGLTKADTCTR